jgi:hypothetical protein
VVSAGVSPLKKRKIRDTRTDTRVTQDGCIDLAIGNLPILTPTQNDTVRYYGRLGLDKLFDRLVRDPPKNDYFRNLALVGHPGAGKRNLVWAVADYLASSSARTVLWVSHRVSGQDWEVRLFEPGRNGAVGSLFEVTNCPTLLSEILSLEIFEHVDVLMLSTLPPREGMPFQMTKELLLSIGQVTIRVKKIAASFMFRHLEILLVSKRNGTVSGSKRSPCDHGPEMTL